jgi:hypothetical protein
MARTSGILGLDVFIPEVDPSDRPGIERIKVKGRIE